MTQPDTTAQRPSRDARREASTDPFFVVGAERSGTTMLRLMLNEHSRLHVPPESVFLSDLMDVMPLDGPVSDAQVLEAERIVKEHVRWKDWGLDDGLLHDALAALDSPSLADVVDVIFRLAAGAKPRWGDKTPRYVKEIGRLHALFPRAKFIHMIRDARDVCISLKAKGWWGGDVVSIGRYWSEQVCYGFDQRMRLRSDLYIEITYEELVRDSEAVLREVCGFLDEEFEPAMLQFYRHARENIPARVMENHTKTERPPRPSDLERWRSELRPIQVLLLEAVAGPAMSRAGQVPHFRWLRRVLRPVLGAAEWVAVHSLRIRRSLGISFGWLWRRL